MHPGFMPRWTRPAIVLAAALALAACTSTTSPSASAGGGGTTVDVALSEFKVEFSTTDIPAGEVTFNVTNDGAIEHEFVVFKTDLAEDALPEEGAEVTEDDPGLTSMGEVEEVGPDTSKSFTATLDAGSYVGICNVTGHYDSGMHIHFTVD